MVYSDFYKHFMNTIGPDLHGVLLEGFLSRALSNKLKAVLEITVHTDQTYCT